MYNRLQCSTEGITVKFLGYFGSIHKTHLEDTPTKFEKLQEVITHKAIVFLHLIAICRTLVHIFKFLNPHIHSLFLLFQIKACVLYVHPTTKSVALTQLTHFVTPDLAPRHPFGELAIGDVMEEAPVWRLDKTRGVYFKLAEKIIGFCHVSAIIYNDVILSLKIP